MNLRFSPGGRRLIKGATRIGVIAHSLGPQPRVGGSRGFAPMSPEGPGATYADSERPPFMSKILSFFSAFRACSIDFGQFILMFRVDAAQYRNAML